jgi:hypothetical protein
MIRKSWVVADANRHRAITFGQTNTPICLGIAQCTIRGSDLHDFWTSNA